MSEELEAAGAAAPAAAEPRPAGDAPTGEAPAAAPGAQPGALSRRRFGGAVVASATAGYAGAMGYPVARYLLSGAEIADEGSQVSEVALGKPDDIPAGSGKNFAFGSRPALIVRGKDGSFAAFLATCTHLGCTVSLDARAWVVRCPCHGGSYDPSTGKNVGGPPPKPLEPLAAVVEAGKLVVRKKGG